MSKKIAPQYKKQSCFIHPKYRTTVRKKLYNNKDGEIVVVDRYDANFTLDFRDNKDRIIYTVGGGSSRIRYPKKIRKNAWKKFYKLFPKLKPGYVEDLSSNRITEEAKLILNKKKK